jgi:trehalose/maltose hydrolase-like predicted phosphorylase
MMHEALQLTQDPGWVLSHEGYDVLTENAVESRFALGNGFLGIRASRPVSRGLPDEFPGAAAKVNFRYYEPRCAHGSSLSAGIHALVAARLGETETALRFLRQAAAADLELDPNSAGGIRIAGLGDLWLAIVLGFACLDLRGEILGIDPALPPQWRSLSFRVCWRGRSVAIRIASSAVEARLVEGEAMEMRIGAAKHKLMPGEAARQPV